MGCEAQTPYRNKEFVQSGSYFLRKEIFSLEGSNVSSIKSPDSKDLSKRAVESRFTTSC